MTHQARIRGSRRRDGRGNSIMKRQLCSQRILLALHPDYILHIVKIVLKKVQWMHSYDSQIYFALYENCDAARSFNGKNQAWMRHQSQTIGNEHLERNSKPSWSSLILNLILYFIMNCTFALDHKLQFCTLSWIVLLHFFMNCDVDAAQRSGETGKNQAWGIRRTVRRRNLIKEAIVVGSESSPWTSTKFFSDQIQWVLGSPRWLMAEGSTVDTS